MYLLHLLLISFICEERGDELLAVEGWKIVQVENGLDIPALVFPCPCRKSLKRGA